MSQSSRSRLPRVLAVLLPIAVGLVILFGPGGPKPVSVDPDPKGERTASEGPENLELEGALERPLRDVAKSPGQEPGATLGSPDDLAPAGGPDPEPEITLKGRIRVFDRDGGEHPGESGTLELRVWLGMSGSTRSVDVEAGHFSLSVPTRARLAGEAAQLGGREARVESAPMGTPAPVDGLLELRAHWTEPHRLLVLDGTRGTHLSGVHLLRPTGLGGNRPPHPGRPERHGSVRVDATSPIELGMPEEIQGDLYVGAPGFAWTLVRLDPNGGEQTVELEPGAALELVLSNGTPPPGAALRLRESSEDLPSVDLPLEEHPSHLIEGLPPGPHRLEISIGSWFRDPERLHDRPIELNAGVTTLVQLDLADATPWEPLSIAGTLRIPESWERNDLELRFRTLDPPRAGAPLEATLRHVDFESTPDAEVFAWSVDGLPSGTWIYGIHPFGIQGRFELQPPGLDGLDLELPAPAELRVRVVDAYSEEELHPEFLLWARPLPEWAPSGSASAMPFDPELRAYVGRVPEGPITVTMFGTTYFAEPLEWVAGVNPTDQVLRALHTSTVELQFLRDGIQQPWNDGWRVSAEHLGGEDGWSNVQPHPLGTRISVAPAGPWRLTFTGFAPNETPGPLEFEAVAGESIEETIGLGD